MLGASHIVAFAATADSAKARAFYEGVLGLRYVFDDPFALVLDANAALLPAGARSLAPVPQAVPLDAGQCTRSRPTEVLRRPRWAVRWSRVRQLPQAAPQD